MNNKKIAKKLSKKYCKNEKFVLLLLKISQDLGNNSEKECVRKVCRYLDTRDKIV